jgi:hypothetical protein
MLTPKCRPRDFRVRMGPNSPKKCLCRLKPNLKGRDQARIRQEFNGFWRDVKSSKIYDLDWLCWQSEANLSLPAKRKMQGDFARLQGSIALSWAENPRFSMC